MKLTLHKFLLFITTLILSTSFYAQEFSLGTSFSTVFCNQELYVVGNSREINPQGYLLSDQGSLGLGNFTSQVNDYQQLNFNFVSPIKKVVSNDYTTLVLLQNGDVWGFGNNSRGDLGIGNQIDQNSPVRVLGVSGVGYLTDIVDIDTSDYNGTSLAIDNQGRVLQWGTRPQLYNQNNLLMLVPEYVINSTTQQPLTNISKIASGYRISYAIDNNDNLWFWGRYLYSGTGLAIGDTFTAVQTPFINDLNSIDVSNEHSIALKNDGTVWTWGSNAYGEMGVGNSVNAGYFPMQVIDVNGFLQNITKIVSNGLHSFALKNDGTLWTWGYNEDGVLGNTNVNLGNSSFVPIQVQGFNGNGFLQNVTDIKTSRKTAVATLNNYACDAVSWGYTKNNITGMGFSNITDSPQYINLNQLSCCGPLVIDSFSEYKADKTTICPGECIEVEALVGSGNPTVTNWIPLGSSSITITSPTAAKICYNTSGNYSIGVITSLNNYPYFGIDITVLPEDSRKCKYEFNDDDYDGTRLSNKVTIYPNPSSSIFNVDLKNTTPFSYKVNNIYGKTILSNTVKNTSILQLDLTKQEKGIYFLIVTTEKGDETFKLIKE
jgi:alpha-tubulin suppressor-like RCC1 family protein